MSDDDVFGGRPSILNSHALECSRLIISDWIVARRPRLFQVVAEALTRTFQKANRRREYDFWGLGGESGVNKRSETKVLLADVGRSHDPFFIFFPFPKAQKGGSFGVL